MGVFARLKKRIDGFMREHAARSAGRSGVDTSLAKTARDATHVRGGKTIGGTGSKDVTKHIAAGHKNYAASFKDKNRYRRG